MKINRLSKRNNSIRCTGSKHDKRSGRAPISEMRQTLNDEIPDKDQEYWEELEDRGY